MSKSLAEYISQKESKSKIIGDIAQKYLSYYASPTVKTEKIFGIKVQNDNLFIGNQPIWIIDNDIKFEEGTIIPGTERFMGIVNIGSS